MLLVDDDQLMRSLVWITLGEEDLDFFEATHASHALAVARSAHPDLVLIDAAVQGLDATAICQALKQEPQLGGVKVVLLVAGTAADAKAQAARAGADAGLSQPFQPADLVSIVRSLLSLA